MGLKGTGWVLVSTTVKRGALEFVVHRDPDGRDRMGTKNKIRCLPGFLQEVKQQIFVLRVKSLKSRFLVLGRDLSYLTLQ